MGLSAHIHLLGQSSDEDIARLAGVPVGDVRSFREKRGIPAPGAPVSSARDAVHRVRARVGRMPDAEVATLAGVTAEDVKVYRRDYGIAPYLRPPPSSASAPAPKPTPAPVVRPSKPSGPVVVRRHTTGEGAPAETVTRPVAPPAPVVEDVTAPAADTSPAARLASFRDRLGLVPDQVIAEEAGVHRGIVGDYRRSLGIRAYDGFRFALGAPKPAKAEAAPRGSAIDAYRALLGTIRDSELAERAGVTRAAVTAYRNRAGIAPYEPPPLELVNVPPPKRGRPPKRAVEPVVEAPVVAAVAVAEPVVEMAVVEAPVVAAPVVVEAVVSAPVVVEAPVAAAKRSPRFGVSKLDAYRDIIGVLFDSEVARRSGMSKETVQEYRKRHGIPAAVVARPVEKVAVAEPVASAVATEVTAVATEQVAVATEQAAVATEQVVVATVPQHAYVVVVDRAGETHRFVAMGANIRDAAVAAGQALAVRPGGPWTITQIWYDREALIAPVVAPVVVVAPVAVVARVVPAAPVVSAAAPVSAAPVVSAAAPVSAAPVVYTGAFLRAFRMERGLPQKPFGVLLGGVGQSMISVAESLPEKPLSGRLLEALTWAIAQGR